MQTLLYWSQFIFDENSKIQHQLSRNAASEKNSWINSNIHTYYLYLSKYCTKIYLFYVVFSVKLKFTQLHLLTQQLETHLHNYNN